MKKTHPKSYQHARADGTTVRVSIPENPTPEELLVDALRAHLSPHAVAAIAALLQPVSSNDADVDRQVRWFTEQLVCAVGGRDQLNRLAKELGL